MTSFKVADKSLLKAEICSQLLILNAIPSNFFIFFTLFTRHIEYAFNDILLGIKTAFLL